MLKQNVPKVRMGQWAQCYAIKSILMKYRDEILKLALCLSTHIIEGKLKMLKTYPKLNLTVFIPYFCAFADFYNDYVEWNCHVSCI